MKIVFGVMSNQWEMEAKDLEVGKLAMVFYIEKNIPIVIYKPKKEVFSPEAFLKSNNPENFEGADIHSAINSIKQVAKR